MMFPYESFLCISSQSSLLSSHFNFSVSINKNLRCFFVAVQCYDCKLKFLMIVHNKYYPILTLVFHECLKLNGTTQSSPLSTCVCQSTRKLLRIRKPQNTLMFWQFFVIWTENSFCPLFLFDKKTLCHHSLSFLNPLNTIFIITRSFQF